MNNENETERKKNTNNQVIELSMKFEIELTKCNFYECPTIDAETCNATYFNVHTYHNFSEDKNEKNDNWCDVIY